MQIAGLGLMGPDGAQAYVIRPARRARHISILCEDLTKTNLFHCISNIQLDFLQIDYTRGTIYILSFGNTECFQVPSDICTEKFEIFYHNHL